jgi:hypothetical protein
MLGHVLSWTANTFKDLGIVADILRSVHNGLVNCLLVVYKK